MVKDIDLEKSPEDEKFKKSEKSILDLEMAQKHCLEIVKRHDYYTYFVGQQFPRQLQCHYYTINAFFLEILKSREVSRQPLICQRRLLFWTETVHDAQNDK